jgi:hypothetical protein
MSDAQQLLGKLILVLPEESGTSAKGRWVKGGFVIETSGQYPKKVAFQVWGDILEQVPDVGTELTVFYNPESREYGGKWYTDLKVWKIELNTIVSKKETKKEVKKEEKPVVKTGLGLGTPENDDDLPF